MNPKSIGISVLVTIVLIGVGLFAGTGLRPSQTTINNPVTEKTILGGNNQDLSNVPYIGVNGNNTFFVNVPFAAGTTTVCSIANPIVSYGGASSTLNMASTTLLYVVMHQTNATTTAITYDIGTSTSPNATTSPMVNMFTVAANATSTSIGWIPTTWTQGLIGTNVFVNVLATKANATSLGFCQAEYRQF